MGYQTFPPPRLAFQGEAAQFVPDLVGSFAAFKRRTFGEIDLPCLSREEFAPSTEVCVTSEKDWYVMQSIELYTDEEKARVPKISHYMAKM